MQKYQAAVLLIEQYNEPNKQPIIRFINNT